jgi:phosphatidate cytidylyltransferase
MTGPLGLPVNVAYATAGIYAVLVLATLVVALLRRHPSRRALSRACRPHRFLVVDDRRLHPLRPRQPVGRGRVPRFRLYLALKEYLSLIPTRRIDRAVLLFAYLAIPIQFYWAAID